MGKDKNKEQDGETAASVESITSPRMPTRPQLGEGSKGHCPSQDNHWNSSKGDGKGSCTLSGFTQ